MSIIKLCNCSRQVVAVMVLIWLSCVPDDVHAYCFGAGADLDDIKQCLDWGADPNMLNRNGNTPLLTAVKSGQLDVVPVLLAAGADPNALDKARLSALHYLFTPKQLSEAGLSVGPFPKYPEVDGRKETLLVTVQVLLQAGANPNARSDNGPCRGSKSLCRTNPVGMHGTNSGDDPVAWGWSGQHNGSTPLHFLASYSKSQELVQALLAAGANPNVRTYDGNSFVVAGVTPLHYAAQGAAETTSTLLAAGADPNARTDGGGEALPAGATPLHWAAFGTEAVETISILLTAGADPNARADNGETPLHVASCSDKTQAVRTRTLLLRAGANSGAKDNNGKTANC